MISYNEAFEILGIERTREQRTIKRAYAQMVKKYHPEEKPEEWQRVHDAYEMALRYADTGRKQEIDIEALRETAPKVKQSSVQENRPPISKANETQTRPPIFETTRTQTKPPIAMPLNTESTSGDDIEFEYKQEEPEIDFEKIAIVAQHNRVKRKCELDRALPAAMELLAIQCAERIQTVKQWRKVLGTDEVQLVKTNPTFLYRVGDLLRKCRIERNVYRIIKKFLEDVYEEMMISALDAGITKANLDAWEVACNGLELAYRGKLAGYSISDVKQKIYKWVRGKHTFPKMNFRAFDFGTFWQNHYKVILAVSIVLILIIANAVTPKETERRTSYTSDEQVVFNQTVKNIDMYQGMDETKNKEQALDSAKQVDKEEGSKKSTTSQESSMSTEEVMAMYNAINMDPLEETMSNTIKQLKERPEEERYKVWEK